MDKEDRDQYTAHHHASHFSYNRVLNNETNGMPVDIGTGIDWTDMTFTEDHSIIEEGEEWVTTHYNKRMSRRSNAEAGVVC